MSADNGVYTCEFCTLIGVIPLPFGEKMQDFWQNHDFWFVLSMMIFPRLTMLFATSTGAGWIYWTAWVFYPRILVAYIATSLYGTTNPTLVMFTWFWAISFENGEKELWTTILKIINIKLKKSFEMKKASLWIDNALDEMKVDRKKDITLEALKYYRGHREEITYPTDEVTNLINEVEQK